MSATPNDIKNAADNILALFNSIVIVCNNVDLYTRYNIYYPKDMQKVLDRVIMLIQQDDNININQNIIDNIRNMQDFINNLTKRKYELSEEYLDSDIAKKIKAEAQRLEDEAEARRIANLEEQSRRDEEYARQFNDDMNLALQLSAEM